MTRWWRIRAHAKKCARCRHDAYPNWLTKYLPLGDTRVGNDGVEVCICLLLGVAFLLFQLVPRVFSARQPFDGCLFDDARVLADGGDHLMDDASSCFDVAHPWVMRNDTSLAFQASMLCLRMLSKYCRPFGVFAICVDLEEGPVRVETGTTEKVTPCVRLAHLGPRARWPAPCPTSDEIRDTRWRTTR